MIGSGHVTGAAFYEQHLPWARALVSVANSPIAYSLRLHREMTALCKPVSHILPPVS